ncbi:MAG TPA: hypothetical protein VMU33_07020 [Burkholderiaceae bacterium]|nr:hypothetical protein [Burkholderiaceae bacterium]
MSNGTNADVQPRAELSATARRRIALLAFAGGMLFAASYLAVLIYWSWQDSSWMLPIVRDHFAAVVGGPCSAFAALLLVLLLRYTVGPIEISGLGFEFKGAAGPIILWIFTFLAMVAAIKMLW